MQERVKLRGDYRSRADGPCMEKEGRSYFLGGDCEELVKNDSRFFLMGGTIPSSMYFTRERERKRVFFPVSKSLAV